MKTKIIKTEQEYNKACQQLYKLINSHKDPIEPKSLEGDKVELLALFIEKYEQEYYQREAPLPIAAIKFRMEQMNLKQADIAPLFGGKTRVSEVLRGKRTLTLKTITLLNRYLGIPLESLINKKAKLEPEKIKQLLNTSSIKKYYTQKESVL